MSSQSPTAPGTEPSGLAGHDWGAAVASSVAIAHPNRVAALAILNVPHPSVMQRFLKSDPGQMLRSWYIGFFQLPWLPEALLSAFSYRAAKRALIASSLPGTFQENDLARYVEAWKQPGALTAMINWYRAALVSLRKPAFFADPHLRLPVLILWGEQDRFLRLEMAQASLRYCESAELRTFPENTHWLHHRRPVLPTTRLSGVKIGQDRKPPWKFSYPRKRKRS